jgi:hypothetical protein
LYLPVVRPTVACELPHWLNKPSARWRWYQGIIHVMCYKLIVCLSCLHLYIWYSTTSLLHAANTGLGECVIFGTHNNSSDVGLLRTQIIPFRLKTNLFLTDSFNVVCILKGKNLFCMRNKKFLIGKCIVSRLWTGWLMNCDLNAVGARDFSLLQNIQTSSGVHLAS